jgi:hypothetical protein
LGVVLGRGHCRACERLETTGVLLKIAIRLDRKLAQRLVALHSNEESRKGSERVGNADLLITTAASIVDLEARPSVAAPTVVC